MQISSNYFLYINVAIIAIYILLALIGYKNGLMLQLVDFIYNVFAIIVAYFISPILASHFPIVKLDEVYTTLGINVILDCLIYSVIVYLVLKIIYVFIKPLFKSVSKIPLIGFLNKIGGLFFGLVNGTLVMLAISLLLSTPIIKNGVELRENTFLKYINNLSKQAIEVSMKYINFDSIKDNIEDFDIDKAREEFNNWLVENGVFHE